MIKKYIRAEYKNWIVFCQKMLIPQNKMEFSRNNQCTGFFGENWSESFVLVRCKCVFQIKQPFFNFLVIRSQYTEYLNLI